MSGSKRLSIGVVAVLALPANALADPPEPCWEFTPGSPPTVVQDEECINEPPIGTFTPVVEWEWHDNPTHSEYYEVMMTPVVGNLTDDDGDGDIDTDDVPDIVFTAFDDTYDDYDYRTNGVIVAISGDGTEDHWSIASWTDGGTTYYPYSAGGVAIGDLEADGIPDICVAGTEVTVICFEANGTFKWAAGTDDYVYACPAIADMNGDGLAEVVVGPYIFDFDGTEVGAGLWGDGRNYMTFPVDWDEDGELEVIGGNAVYERDGTTTWYVDDDGDEVPDDDGIPAVGDFDGDQKPDLVRVTWGTVYMHYNDGTLGWEFELPDYVDGDGNRYGSNGGAPTIADFDGDGEPEVGVAGRAAYIVLDTDGEVLWSNTVQDFSSSVTGSSVYDFEGDGQAEVVYADERTLWVFDGKTGDVLMEEGTHESATLYEYPVIADVDGDGHTEIVVISNSYPNASAAGVTIIGDEDDSWYPARPIWNQHAYHITNVDNDGKIPVVQNKNWLRWNNFRAGGTELGPSHWMAQLASDPGEMCLTDCSTPAVEIYLPVYNKGLLDAPTFDVAFYRVKSSTRTKVHTGTAGPLAAGDSEMAGPFTITESMWQSGQLVAVVDDADVSFECDETDNEVELGSWPYPEDGAMWDADDDGYVDEDCGGDDCDDEDASINPGATDIPDDDIDQDCSGDDTVCDGDDDGWDNEDCGGDDCDDTDPDINPGADEIPGDGIDQNCDGNDPDSGEDGGDAELRQTCGCGSCDTVSGASAVWLWMLGLLGVVWRRRSA